MNNLGFSKNDTQHSYPKNSQVDHRKNGSVLEDRKSKARESAKGSEQAITIENVKMERQVGLTGGVAFIVGTVIGSGIFISPKGVLRGTGSVAASLLVWTGCGCVALCGALCYAELGTMIPHSGSEFHYLLESMGPVPAFLQAWIKLVTSKTSSQAVISLTFAQYVLAPVFDECGPPLFLLKLVAALVIGHTEEISTGFEGSETDPSVIALAFYNGLWAYGGWNSLNYLTEELINPNVNLPRSIIIAVPLVTIIYLLTNISYLAVLSKSALPASPAVAVILFPNIFGGNSTAYSSWGDRILGFGSLMIPFAVACSTFGALNGSIFTGGRLCYVAARAGHFPPVLSYVNVHQRTPLCSVIFTTIIALLMVIPGNIKTLINFLTFTGWMIYGATISGVIIMRFTHKDLVRPYKVPIILPVAMVLVSVYLVLAPIIRDQKVEFLYAVVFICVGLILYVPFVHFQVKLRCMDYLTTWIQLFLEVAPSKFEP